MEFVIHEHPVLVLGHDRHLRIECSVQTQNALLHKLIEQPLPEIIETEPIFSLELRRELSGTFSAPVENAVFGASYFLVGRVRRFSSTRVRIHSCYALSTGASEAESIRVSIKNQMGAGDLLNKKKTSRIIQYGNKIH